MRRFGWTLIIAATAACSRSSTDRSTVPDATLPAAVSDDSPTARLASWPDALGGFLAVANSPTGDALLFRRDTSAAIADVSVVGFDSAATPVPVRDVRAVPCAARALLRMADAPPGWSLALETARARPLLVDALEDLARTDSARVVVRIQRALNTLADSGDALEFRGLPVVVRDAWIVQWPGAPLVVARAARLRNLEATAHEELRFVVLDGDQPRYVARVAGDEETVESWELLAALSVHGQPWLAVAREGVRSMQLELIARDSASWQRVWRSDAISCTPAPSVTR